MQPIQVQDRGLVRVLTLDRPDRKNAIDRATAEALADAARAFEADPAVRVAVLTGAGGSFCAGADLRAIASGAPNRLAPDGDAPLGPSRMRLDKPVIAAIEGYAVAGGLELACWCDLRVAAADAVLGVFCRRFGVPLIDGGTVRLPRIIGLGRALDLILTGRPVNADEALRIGLVDRVVPTGQALDAAIALAEMIAAHPWACALSDRRAVCDGLDRPLDAAMAAEFAHGMGVIDAIEPEKFLARLR